MQRPLNVFAEIHVPDALRFDATSSIGIKDWECFYKEIGTLTPHFRFPITRLFKPEIIDRLSAMTNSITPFAFCFQQIFQSPLHEFVAGKFR